MRAKETRRPIIGAGVVVWRGPEVLLIRRGKEPRRGEWSLPGGGQQWGETLQACALRELKEETGLDGQILGLIDVVDAIFPGPDGCAEQHYSLIDFAVRPAGGELKAGDDATDARWHRHDSLGALGLWSETLRVIEAARRFF
jgi:8-oxo-dGTP diphosphatase